MKHFMMIHFQNFIKRSSFLLVSTNEHDNDVLQPTYNEIEFQELTYQLLQSQRGIANVWLNF
jgi:hypothetical protein